MSQDQGKPVFKNTLLSAASTGFSFEDAALLVPVLPLKADEPSSQGFQPANILTDASEGIAEIDLNSEDPDPEESSHNWIPSSTSFAPPPSVEQVKAAPPPQPPAARAQPPPTLSREGSGGPIFASELFGKTEKEEVPLFRIGGESQGQGSGSDFWSNLGLGQYQPSAPPPLPIAQPGPPPPQWGMGMAQSPPSGPPFPPVTTAIPSAAPPPTQFQPQGPGEAQQRGFTPPQPTPPPPSSFPTGPPLIPSAPPPITATTSNQNSFRLGHQRPVYAKYPGLSNPQSPSAPPAGVVPPPLSGPFQQQGNGFGEVKQELYSPSTYSAPTGLSQSQGMPMTSQNNAQFLDQAVPASSYFSAPPTTPYAGPYQSGTPQDMSYYHEPVGTSPPPPPQYTFKPLTYHWFYRQDVKGKVTWKSFSSSDSAAMEKAFLEGGPNMIPTDGGRYDVNVFERKKYAVYWEENSTDIKRCSWFYKGPLDRKFVPYEEELAEKLENEYLEGFRTGIWGRRMQLDAIGEVITFINPNAISHFCRAASADEWGNVPESQLRPRTVKRGVEDIDVEEDEPSKIDHLVFIIHGIGSVCDLQFRTIVEAVDEFRTVSHQLMQSHFKEAVESQKAGRVEFLPVSWHKALHGEGGIDKKIQAITLKSIPMLRNFTNLTLLDVLFYTSPCFAQSIIDTVGSELNRLYALFLERNPGYGGQVAVAGHSLGSLILFDLLAHQPSGGYNPDVHGDDQGETGKSSKISESLMVPYTKGSGTGQTTTSYPVLRFNPTAFFALGSPIGMFVLLRGIDCLGEDFQLATCPAFFNIFHPFDPVAYRIETLIDPTFDLRPVLVPHHKGRKRFHLELKETMQRVGADIKKKFMDSVKSTWNTVYQMATFGGKTENLEQEIDRVLEGEINQQEMETNSTGSAEDLDPDMGPGRLNGGRRIDFVLQEGPLESINEYVFALGSHVCYWASEDTMLMMLREIYATMGVFTKTSQAEQDFYGNLPSLPAVPSPQAYQLYQPSADPPFPGPSPALAPVAAAIAGPPTHETDAGPPPLFMNPNQGSSSQLTSTGPPPSMVPVPPPVTQYAENSNKPKIIGARPVLSIDEIASLRGMDPTQPPSSSAAPPPPPPRSGFQPKK